MKIIENTLGKFTHHNYRKYDNIEKFIIIPRKCH